MKKRIMLLLKYCRPLYVIYYYLGSLFLNGIKIFIKTDDKLILFNSFGGKKFDDSPKAIYEAMINSPDFQGYRFVWAFSKPENFQIPAGTKIKSDTLSYFLTALKARCWITNSSLERGLGFTGKNTFFLNTWHGTPIKKMGQDMVKGNNSFDSKNRWNMDVMTVQSHYDEKIFTHAFKLKEGVCHICGLPRNDVLARADEKMKQECRKSLGISSEKKVILYAPTFREYQQDEQLQCVLTLPVDFGVWQKTLEDSYVVLLRAHYESVQGMDLEQYGGFVMDVSDYPQLNTLMIAADLLISDYSSIFFDYAILERPMLSFTYDFDRYQQKRGMYLDVREWLGGGSVSQEELLRQIRSLEVHEKMQEACAKTKAFQKAFVEAYGHSTDYVLNIIQDALIGKIPL